MSEFDFFTIIVAIPLGLALGELAQGLSLALRRRDQIRIGLYTPLAASILLLLTVDIWLHLWSVREAVDVSRLSIVMGLLVSVAFYVAASCVFPHDVREGMDLDDWFKRYRIYALGATFVIVLSLRIAEGTAMPSFDVDKSLTFQFAYLVGWSVRPALILAAIFAKRRLVILAALGALLAGGILTLI